MADPNLSVTIPSVAKRNSALKENYFDIAEASSPSSPSTPNETTLNVNEKALATSVTVIEDGDRQSQTTYASPVPSWLRFLTVFISGVGLLTNGYNAMVIGYMRPVFRELYPSLSSTIENRMTNAYLIGEIFGMIIFGQLIDRIGRKTGIILTTTFLVLGIAIVAAAGTGFNTTETGLFWTIIIGRGISGFGAGGEFPVSASGATEASNENEADRKNRGLKVAMSTGFSLDLGFVSAGAIVAAVLTAYHQHVNASLWRCCFAIGAVLPLVNVFFRIKLINNKQYDKHAIKHNVPYKLAMKMYWRPFLGMAGAWFCYGAMYPFGLYAATIVQELKPGLTLRQIVGYGTVTQLAYLVGAPIGGILMDRIGRKRTMAYGFMVWFIVAVILGATLPEVVKSFPGFIAMYFLFNIMSEIGPGPTMHVCGTESFPTPIRGHFVGVLAAFGRTGSAISTVIFQPIHDAFPTDLKGEQAVFLIASAFALLGSIFAFFLVPDRDRDLESEDAKFDAFLKENGYPSPHQGAEIEVKGDFKEGDV